MNIFLVPRASLFDCKNFIFSYIMFLYIQKSAFSPEEYSEIRMIFFVSSHASSLGLLICQNKNSICIRIGREHM
jgi:hypothetical protein